jgi:hypothetical protein
VLPAWTGGSLEDLRHTLGISKAHFIGTSGSIKAYLSNAHGSSLEYPWMPDDGHVLVRDKPYSNRPADGDSERTLERGSVSSS